MSSIDTKGIEIPETFGENGSGERWFTSIVIEAMENLYKNIEDDNLESAISAAKIYCSGNDELINQCSMLTLFLRKERSGNLKPPPSLKLIYKQVIERMSQAA